MTAPQSAYNQAQSRLSPDVHESYHIERVAREPLPFTPSDLAMPNGLRPKDEAALRAAERREALRYAGGTLGSTHTPVELPEEPEQ